MRALFRGKREGDSQRYETGVPDNVPRRPAMSATDAAAVSQAMLETLLNQRDGRIEGGFYWESQIAFAYNSNKIEGSALTEEQTRQMFETRRITTSPGQPVGVDDVIEMRNHFRLFDFVLDTYDAPLDASYLKKCQGILKAGVADAPGEWKKVPNGVGGFIATAPEAVDGEIARLLDAYNGASEYSYRTLAAMHAAFERIHPFMDGNGRVGRAVLYKECLAHKLVPFIITDVMKAGYYEGLRIFGERGDVRALEESFARAADGYYAQYANLLPSSFLLPNRDRARQPVDAIGSTESVFGEQRASEIVAGEETPSDDASCERPHPLETAAKKIERVRNGGQPPSPNTEPRRGDTKDKHASR